MTENWYIVLQLEFDPDPVHDETAIAERIEEKRKFWSGKANDFNHGAEYRKYSQMLPDIKKDMIGQANIRDELIKDACERTYGPIDKTLKMIKKTEIPEDTVVKIAVKHKVDAEAVKRRAAALGIKIGASKGGGYQALYDRYYKTKPQNADKYNGMNAFLKSFHVTNLYDFLYAGTSVKNPRNLPCDALRRRARDKKAKEFYKNDSVSGSGSKLCGQCEECFKDEAAKQIYDKYLEYNKRKAVLDEVKNSYDLVGELTQEGYSDFIGQLTELFKNRTEAENLLTAFCKVEKIPVLSPGAPSPDSDIKICRCGCINDIGDGRKVCRSCGLGLRIKCPECGTVNDANINVCKCGFPFANIDKAVSLCELASDALDALDFQAAEAHLSDAGKYWPACEKLSELRARLTELKKRVGGIVGDMRRACKEKRYYEAKRQLEGIRKFAPAYSDPLLEEEIRHAVETAETFKKAARSSKDESDIVEAYVKAYEACSDCPGAKEMIFKYPPAAPSNLNVSADRGAKVNVLTWTKSVTSGLIYYSVVRKEGAVPAGIEDGFLVGRVSMCSMNDGCIKPGIQYFYAVFAERAGVFSDALACGEAVCNLFEVSDVKIAVGDGLVQLTWEPPADNACVEIEKTDERGKKTRVVCNSRNRFEDKGLKNDCEYWYKVYLTYTVGSKKMSTPGIRIAGIPTRPPLPVERLVVKPLQGNEFRIEWENPEGGEVVFYRSARKPNLYSGDLVPLPQLEESMDGLVVNKISDNRGTFRLEGEEFVYIVAAAVKSGSAVIGTIARAGGGGPVKIHNAGLVNGKIMIALDLPPNCTGLVVLYRYDRFPDDISDVDTVRKYVPLKQFTYDGGLVIDSNEPQNYYFSIFAEFKRDGESDYSIGADYLFSNVAKKIITYGIHVNKKFFGGGTIDITFECGGGEFVLPDIDIISAQDRAPMFKKTGKLFYQVPGRNASGTVSVSIPLNKGIARETYIKPFLKDEGLSGRYVLKAELGSDYKIS